MVILKERGREGSDPCLYHAGSIHRLGKEKENKVQRIQELYSQFYFRLLKDLEGLLGDFKILKI